MQPLRNCNGPTIRIGREILYLPYAVFLILDWHLTVFVCITYLYWLKPFITITLPPGLFSYNNDFISTQL